MKRFISLALTLAILATAFCSNALAASSGAGAEKFKDVPKTAWYFPYVDRLTKDGIISGISADKFAPNSNITFCEFVALIIHATVGDLPKAEKGQHWAQNWMSKANELGVLTSEECPRDKWTQPIPRQAMALVVVRTLEIVKHEPSVGNTDEYVKRIGDWDSLCHVCQPYIAQAYAKGIIVGIDGKFKGEQSTTRGEATCVIVKVIDSSYRAEWHGGIPFSPATDVTETGTMKAGVAEKFIMETLANMRYYKENGTFVLC
ncbi:hypothetical protein FACS1894208_05260 [Clostridia bacterium]|nr:hypothetical protein FACS1894208_05260 [Clostridia bacterium]